MPDAIREGDIPGVQLRWRRTLPAAVEEVWPWLVESERLARWVGRDAELSTGAAEWGLEIATVDRRGRQQRERWRSLESAPPRRRVDALQRLDAGWDAATRVTLELAPTEGGCEIMVFQQGFEQLSFSICLTEWERFRRRWRWAFERLAERLGAADG